MKYQLRLEEVGMFVLGMLLFASLDYAWWIFLVLILVPDISMAGYLVNNRIGAVLYNFFHHKGVAICVYAVGFWLQSSVLMLSGVILFAHASMDRILGYGLKYPESFKHTHLGRIGGNTNQ